MSIISIKRYLNSGESSLRQVVASLIEKLGECGIDGYPEKQNFCAEMKAIHEALSPDLPNENVLTLVGSATRSLEAYNGQMNRVIARQTTDFHAIIRMLQEALLRIAGGDAESVHSLSKISEELERGIGFKDLQSLKSHLGTCLSSFREEIERAKTEAQIRVENLQIEIETFRKCTGRFPRREVDPATGALLKEDCAASIRRAINQGTRCYCVVMVVNRVQFINARHGREAGDLMLLRFKEHVESQLIASDQLFRWTGPAMVAILERPEGVDHIRNLVKRMLDKGTEIEFVRNNRSVLIPLSAVWSMFMLTSTPEATEKQIETFIASRGAREFT